MPFGRLLSAPAIGFPPTSAAAATAAMPGLTPMSEQMPTADKKTPISKDRSRVFTWFFAHQLLTPSPKDSAFFVTAASLARVLLNFATASCSSSTLSVWISSIKHASYVSEREVRLSFPEHVDISKRRVEVRLRNTTPIRFIRYKAPIRSNLLGVVLGPLADSETEAQVRDSVTKAGLSARQLVRRSTTPMRD